MNSNRNPSQRNHAGRLNRAAVSVRQFFERALTPVGNPPAPVRKLPDLPEDDHLLKGRRQSFSGQLFSELLTELPMHRRHIARAGENGDTDVLRNAVHKLLGAVVYCDAPELEDALRELRLAIKTENPDTIGVYHDRAINVIDSTLRYSGYRGYE